MNIYNIILTFFISSSLYAQTPPNFLVILVDDLGETDLGTYGNEFIETPNIDQLAEDGMKWVNAYSGAPVCSPSRAAFLTGKNPARVHFTGHITAIGKHRHPANSMIIPPKDLLFIPLEELILPELVKSSGYRTISIGKWHVGPKGYWPLDMGFDENIGGWTHGSPPSHFYPYEDENKKWNPNIPTLKDGAVGEYLSDRLTNEAIKYIHRNKDNPFLIYLPYYAVHAPLQAPKELVEKYKKKQLTKDANPEIDPTYAAMVDRLDQNIGRLLGKLESEGISENTVVIFASDNGAERASSDMMEYRAGKGHLYEGGLRVPFIMKWPNHIKANSVNKNRTRSEDVFATIADIVGYELDDDMNIDGESLVSQFTNSIGQDINNERDMFWYYPHYLNKGNYPGGAIISGDYKYIEFFDPNKIELYNIKLDPGEKTDLSHELPEKVIELSGKFNLWLHEVKPILHTSNPNYKNQN
ncbi:sulfatase [Membranihabitans marinus]|uniref:sulfatase n=1 Tax=Membranihabitans marinus TaxID=1227546 RepID=UPI001F47AA82|nr:sulfatase [Membranihabitans marinus]